MTGKKLDTSAGGQIGIRAVDSLIPYARNARTHSDAQVAQIAASISEFGFNNPILTHGDGVVAGHGRLLAARKLGMATVPCLDLAHLTKTQARAYVLADNQLAMNAGWDQEMLALELVELKDEGVDLDILGFPDVDALLATEAPAGLLPGTDEDAVPDAPKVAITKPGDVITLGRHRLMCGDSTNRMHVDRLMDGANADIVVFDPPYEQEAIYSAVPEPLSGQKLLVMWDMYRFGTAPHRAIMAGWTPLYEFIWDCVTSWYVPNRPLARHKACGVFGDDPKFNFDDAIIRDGKKREAKTVYNSRGESEYTPLDGAVHIRTVEAFPTTGENGGHAHSKPVAWIEAIFRGVGGVTVLDLFAGSGTSVICCEKTGQICRMMEMDPCACDVIVKRWEEATGRKAVRPKP